MHLRPPEGPQRLEPVIGLLCPHEFPEYRTRAAPSSSCPLRGCWTRFHSWASVPKIVLCFLGFQFISSTRNEPQIVKFITCPITRVVILHKELAMNCEVFYLKELVSLLSSLLSLDCVTVAFCVNRRALFWQEVEHYQIREVLRCKTTPFGV